MKQQQKKTATTNRRKRSAEEQAKTLEDWRRIDEWVRRQLNKLVDSLSLPELGLLNKILEGGLVGARERFLMGPRPVGKETA